MNESGGSSKPRMGWVGRCLYGVATVLMNATVYPLLIFWSLLCGLLFPFYFGLTRLCTGWDAGRIMRLYIWIYGRGWLGLAFLFAPFRRERFDRHPLPTPCILVVNHYSFFDTYFMGGLPVFDVAFAVRSWPFRMFWYAYFMRMAGYLDVEGDEWEDCLASCRRTIAAGGNILFFPEGHRSRDGRLQRFYSGAFRVSIELGVPLVPLCLTGTDRLLPPGRRSLRPARVRLRTLPAFAPDDYPGALGYVKFRREVREAMAQAVDEMRREEGR